MSRNITRPVKNVKRRRDTKRTRARKINALKKKRDKSYSVGKEFLVMDSSKKDIAVMNLLH